MGLQSSKDWLPTVINMRDTGSCEINTVVGWRNGGRGHFLVRLCSIDRLSCLITAKNVDLSGNAQQDVFFSVYIFLKICLRFCYILEMWERIAYSRQLHCLMTWHLLRSGSVPVLLIVLWNSEDKTLHEQYHFNKYQWVATRYVTEWLVKHVSSVVFCSLVYPLPNQNIHWATLIPRKFGKRTNFIKHQEYDRCAGAIANRKTLLLV